MRTPSRATVAAQQCLWSVSAHVTLVRRRAAAGVFRCTVLRRRAESMKSVHVAPATKIVIACCAMHMHEFGLVPKFDRESTPGS